MPTAADPGLSVSVLHPLLLPLLARRTQLPAGGAELLRCNLRAGVLASVLFVMFENQRQ